MADCPASPIPSTVFGGGCDGGQPFPAGEADIDSLVSRIEALDRVIAQTQAVGLPLEDRIGAPPLRRSKTMSGYSSSTVGILSRQGCPTKRGGKNHLIGIVEKRLRAQFEAAGGVGYTEAERELRVSELTKQRRRLVAECELYQRTLEQAGLTVTRPISMPETYLASEESLTNDCEPVRR
jgi:hypothetical protein